MPKSISPLPKTENPGHAAGVKVMRRSRLAPSSPRRPAYAEPPRRLLVSVDDTTPVEVVRRELHLHAVAGHDSNAEPAHLAGDVTDGRMTVVQVDAEHAVAEGLGNLALQLDSGFLDGDSFSFF